MPFSDIKIFTLELFSKLPVKMLVEAIKTLLNKVDDQENKITEVSSETQKLKDEINRLKGEKGKPVIAKNKDDKKKKELSDEFDLIFSGKTCYFALNQLMEKTRAKKDELLLVLEFPTIPLHNNTSELAMREKVIQRKIRGYFRSLEGAMASDIFLGLMGTCRKIGISFGEYLKDRFYHRHELPPLGDLIWMA